MKIYIGSRQINDSSYKVITEPQILNYLAEDAECTTIVFDHSLRKLSLEQIGQALLLANKKLRIGGIIKIIDIDFDLINYAYTKENNIVKLNQAVFTQSECRSFLTFEMIKEIMGQLQRFKLLGANIAGIEFDAEFKRYE